MSTQCGVAIKTEKGYETIYVHSDGSPDYMWPMLTDNYNSEKLATKLVSMGDASYISDNLEPKGPHSFEKPDFDVCCFYHRDRGERWDQVSPITYLKKELFNSFYYSYVWENGKWNFYKGGVEVY